MLRLRKARALSLDDLARRSGISKSMLSQIERDRTNPTVATLWRIAGALDVGIDSILAPRGPADVVNLLPGYGTPAFTSADARMHWRILGPVELAGRFEWYELRAEPRSQTTSEGHEVGATEHVTVLEGELRVTSGERTDTIAAGATARYRADVRHSLSNETDAPAVALVVVTRVL
jgi:transcriptional regulator with XRE-family HTH domain